jgi:hypothetical protein
VPKQLKQHSMRGGVLAVCFSNLRLHPPAQPGLQPVLLVLLLLKAAQCHQQHPSCSCEPPGLVSSLPVSYCLQSLLGLSPL